MTENNGKPFIYSLYEKPMKPEEIEQRSFEAIDREAPPNNFSPDEWVVVRRMIHTTASFDLADLVRFSPDAIASAIEALRRGAKIYADSNMIRSGISQERLKAVFPGYSGNDIICKVADRQVAAEAKKAGLPRSLFAVRGAKEALHGGIAVFGNAPVALLELNRMIVEEGIRPALVIAMPVGFVHVEECKQEVMALGVPYIAVNGRRGGSTLAVSVIHSLCALAQNGLVAKPAPATKRGVILLGHGSRVPDAGKGMETVADRLREEGTYAAVETCYMSRLGPHMPEAMAACAAKGVEQVVVVPYFLHSGLHQKLDIPAMIKEESKKYPSIKIVYGRHLGFDEKMLDIVKLRISQSWELDDIRQLAIDPREKYPLPPGQMEFVPVSPEEAAERRKKGCCHEHHHDH